MSSFQLGRLTDGRKTHRIILRTAQSISSLASVQLLQLKKPLAPKIGIESCLKHSIISVR